MENSFSSMVLSAPFFPPPTLRTRSGLASFNSAYHDSAKGVYGNRFTSGPTPGIPIEEVDLRSLAFNRQIAPPPVYDLMALQK